MTPAPNTRIKLNELNTILDEMKMGEEAVKKLADMDSQLGIQDPTAVARRMRGDKVPELDTAPVQSSGDALGDAALAANLRQQAERMSLEANGLLAEAQRLVDQACGLDPVMASPALDSTPVKTKGRPKKTPVTAA
jgi:hypothetical protein